MSSTNSVMVFTIWCGYIPSTSHFSRELLRFGRCTKTSLIYTKSVSTASNQDDNSGQHSAKSRTDLQSSRGSHTTLPGFDRPLLLLLFRPSWKALSPELPGTQISLDKALGFSLSPIIAISDEHTT